MVGFSESQARGLGGLCGLGQFLGSSLARCKQLCLGAHPPLNKCQSTTGGTVSTLRAGAAPAQLCTVASLLPNNSSFCFKHTECQKKKKKKPRASWFYIPFYISCLDVLIYMLNHKKGTNDLF